MAPGIPKADKSKREATIEGNKKATTEGNKNGISKPTSRQASVERNNLLKKKKNDQYTARNSKKEELKILQKTIDATQKRMEEEDNEEKQSEIQESLKEMLSNIHQMEKDLKVIDEDLMEIDTEIKGIGKPLPMDVDGENEMSGNLGQSGSATPQAADTSSENESLPNSRNPHTDDLSQASASETELSTQPRSSNEHQVDSNGPVASNELFVGLEIPSDQPQPISVEMDHQPKDFDDLRTLPTPAKAHTGFSLENGFVLLYANRRRHALNFYGARNSPMLIWSTVKASGKLDNVTNLLGAPHSKAMERDDEADVYRYKGKISAIKAIAWLPRNGGDTMVGILKSVEELNPSNKVIKYIYPFSTVLVELEGTATQPGGKNQAVWIDRTKYKTLSSTGKDSSARTDRKFYEMACLQVRRFREWAGKRLDEGWKGEAREERDQSPTPLRETPLPESGIVNQGPAAQNQNPQNQNPQNQNPQNQNPQNQNPQNQNPQSQNAQNLEPHSQSNPETPPQSLSGNTVVHEQRQENPPQLTYHKKKYLKEMLGMIDDFGSLGMQEKMEARSHALAQFHIYQQAMELQGAIEVTD